MKKKIFFLEGNRDGTIGGSYYVLYDLLYHLDKSRFLPVVGFHRDNLFVEKFRELGMETHVLELPQPLNFRSAVFTTLLAPLKKGINLFRELLLPACRYAFFLRKNKIDLVNLNNSITRNHCWSLAALLSRTPCITHEMGINDHYSGLDRYFGKRMKAVICVSHAIREHMRKHGVVYPGTVVVQNGLDTERYQVRTPSERLREVFAVDGNSPIIGVVGNIKKWKGQETALRAISLLKQTFPDIRCLLVGDTGAKDRKYHDHLSRLCSELDIEANVVFTGFQENPIDYLNLMDIFLHTSIRPEPFGIVLLEAMLLGKPIIATNIGGPTEIVVHGKTGFLVAPGEPGKLARTVTALLQAKELAAEIGEAGHRRLFELFTIQRNVEKTTKVYEEIFCGAKNDGKDGSSAS